MLHTLFFSSLVVDSRGYSKKMMFVGPPVARGNFVKRCLLCDKGCCVSRYVLGNFDYKRVSTVKVFLSQLFMLSHS